MCEPAKLVTRITFLFCCCVGIECPSPLEAPTNGQIFCSNGITLGSKCNFTCNPEYELVGDQSSECLEGENGDILWSKPVPFCKGECSLNLNRFGGLDS